MYNGNREIIFVNRQYIEEPPSIELFKKKKRKKEEEELLQELSDEEAAKKTKFGETKGTFRMMQLFKQAFLRKLGQYTQKEANPYRTSDNYITHLKQVCEDEQTFSLAQTLIK